MFSSVHILYVDVVIVVVVPVAVSFLSFRIYVSKITNIYIYNVIYKNYIFIEFNGAYILMEKS